MMRIASQYPDLILLNGKIHTQDKRLPLVRAVAVSKGRIIAVGDNDLIEMAWPGTRIVDLEGRTVLPGFMDPHFHFHEFALFRRHSSLADAGSFDELISRVRSIAETRTHGQWIIGQGWNEAEWPQKKMPDRSDLDRAAPHHPVILWRCDMHLAAANSLALKLGGIDQRTPDPPGGRIEKNSEGVPTGILREMAVHQVASAIPESTDLDVLEAMQDAVPALHDLGITGIHDVRLFGGKECATVIRLLELLRHTGGLDLRCWVSLSRENLDNAIALGLRTGFGNSKLKIGHVKFFMDGGMGARTAWTIDPYLDGENGMPLISPEILEQEIRKAHRAGLAAMVHAVGDRANREVIGIFERLRSHRSRTGIAPVLPHRIEHVQMIRPEDAARLPGLDLVVCAQPHNMILDMNMNMVDESVGEKGRWVYAFKTLMDTGVPVMFGSDAPVCDPAPLKNIWAAVNRVREDGTPEGGWYPDQRIRIDQAVEAYTLIPAQVHGLENELGSISTGKRADMVVLHQDIYTIDPMEIGSTQVVMTVFDGRIVMDQIDGTYYGTHD